MKPYLDLLADVRDNGYRQQNRTGIPSLVLPGAMLKFDLRNGFPVVTTRHAPVKSSIAEMIGFLRGCTNAADFRALGCKFWDGNANRNEEWLANPVRKGHDDLGEIYGHFWRQAPNRFGEPIDQVQRALRTLHTNPQDRRMIVSGWQVDAIAHKRGALPPCHIAWHLIADVERQVLHLCMWQRSCDMVLGIGGGNISGYAFLLAWLARLSGYTPGTLTMHLDDVHIYENHLEGVAEMLSREPRPLPALLFDGDVPSYAETGCFAPEEVGDIKPSQVHVLGYDPHPAIAFEMAV